MGERISIYNKLDHDHYIESSPFIYIPSTIKFRKEKLMKRIVRRLRVRERREFEHQIKYLETYMSTLADIKVDIIKYLKKDVSTRGPPTPDMIAFAKHSWSYNELSPEDRYILSKMRLIVEDHLHEISAKLPEIDKPICAICRDALVGENSKPTIINCGHIFHERCIRRLFCEYDSQCPVCRAPMRWAMDMFYSYE